MLGLLEYFWGTWPSQQPQPQPQAVTSFGSPSTDFWWDHPVLDGYDSDILAIEGIINESAGQLSIPWLLALSVSQGNAMTDAIARNAVVFCDPEWGLEGGGGGNESGAQMFGGAQSSGLIVSW